MSARRPRVAMVTGAYFPELSGGGLQARAVARALANDADFAVITTSIDPSLPREADEDGVRIHRIHVDPASRWSTLRASIAMARVFVGLRNQTDVVNLHGFSRKAALIRLLARLFRKPFVLTLQTGGHDAPAAADALGRMASWAYRTADLFLSVSPGLSRAYLDAGLAPGRLRQVCNAVDVQRFHPADGGTRAQLRTRLGLPRDGSVVLFVGYFSSDKRPHVLFEAWRQLPANLVTASTLVFVGATKSAYGEIEPGLADRIRADASAAGLAGRLQFIEWTDRIDEYFRASDVYVLPSIREGLPIALIEAMACALPCVASRLDGSTDAVITADESGILVPPDDVGAFARALERVLVDRDLAARLGQAARSVVERRFSIQATAPLWLDAYRSLVPAGRQ